MKRRSKFLSVLAAVALAMAPLTIGGETISLAAGGAASQSQAAATSDQPNMVSMDASATVDDCCLPHGNAGDPCVSAACCGVHCVSATLTFQGAFRLVAEPLRLGPIVRDQMLASFVGSPPFRPPRG